MTDISFPCFKIHWSVLHDTDGQWPKVYCESNLRLRSVIMFCNENVFGPTDHSPSPAPALSWWLGKSAWLGPPVPRHCEGSSCAPRLAASRAGLNPSRGLHRPHPLTPQSNYELVWVSRDTMFWELYLLIKHSSFFFLWFFGGGLFFFAKNDKGKDLQKKYWQVTNWFLIMFVQRWFLKKAEST